MRAVNTAEPYTLYNGVNTYEVFVHIHAHACSGTCEHVNTAQQWTRTNIRAVLCHAFGRDPSQQVIFAVHTPHPNTCFALFPCFHEIMDGS